MKVLIIGGTAFTGPYIVRGLLELGHEVTLFHRGHSPLRLHGVTEILGDKGELVAQKAAFQRLSPDVIIHMTALTREDAEVFVSTFTGIAKRALVISSGDVYLAYGRMHGTEPGPPEALPLYETSPLRLQLGPEGQAYNKTAVESVVCSEPRLPVTVLRFSAIYGPGDHQRRFSEFFRRIADRRPGIIIGESDAHFRFSHAYCENAANAVMLAATSSNAANRVYNVAERDTPTGVERLRRISSALGWDGRIVVVPDANLPQHLRRPPIHVEQDLVIDSTRIRDELGYSELVDDDEAIRRTYAWQVANPLPNGAIPDYETEDRLLVTRP